MKILKSMFEKLFAKLKSGSKTKAADDVNAAKESEQKKEQTGQQ